MAIKIFSAPGDHRDDFETVETQVNSWLGENSVDIKDMKVDVSVLPERRDTKAFMMTVVLRYEAN